ncbi:putative transmembrane protein [Apostichopus japonicus]|uniref:Putative transmembrane protein n=1 Tax=Stichopus japonicus TaxID=307972 RepID=A0A2G8LS26_STIJA|nr:putative transmembrane protein [Apostichopus japonicus]
MYIWRRLVSDIEESRQYELQSRYGVLPVTDEALSAENDVTFIQLERFNIRHFLPFGRSLVLKVNEIDIPIRELPSSLEQFSIVQVCDFHIGPWLWKEHVEKVVDKVNDLHPDIVVIVGDLVDLTTDKVLDAIQPLERLTSKKGIFFVGGNHDYYLGDIENLYKHLEETGIKVLSNESVKICRDADDKEESCFYLVGTEDISQGQGLITKQRSGRNFSLTQALVGVDSEMPVVLLTHQPSAAKRAILTDQRFDLILSGHTHGGQFFPVSLVVYLSVPYFYGLYHVKESTYLYVSSGVGFWGIPMRFMAPPEVAVLSLVSDTGSSHAAINRA